MPADRLVAIPEGVSDRVACGLLLKGATAASIIERIFPPRAGQIILVHAAASGVGSLLTRWSAHLGATVIGTVGSADKARAALANGAAQWFRHIKRARDGARGGIVSRISHENPVTMQPCHGKTGTNGQADNFPVPVTAFLM